MTGAFELALKKWFETLKNYTLYKNAILGMLVYIGLLIGIFGVLLLPPLVLLGMAPTLGAILFILLLLVAAVVSIYVAQIPTAIILRTLENPKQGFSDMLSYIIKNKVKNMGNATIAYLIIVLVYLGLMFAPLVIGIMADSSLLIGLGVLLLLVGIFGLIIIAYFLWLTPIIAFKENIGIRAINRSFNIMKNAGWTGVGLFLVISFLASILGYVLNYLLQVPLNLMIAGSLINPAALMISAIFALVLWGVIMVVVSSIVQVIYVSGQVIAYQTLSTPVSQGKTRKTVSKRSPIKSKGPVRKIGRKTSKPKKRARKK